MAVVSFAKMKLKVDNSTNDFDFEYNNEKFPIEVYKYLPISDKEDLIQIALQKATRNGIIDEVALEMYFNLNILYLYTNINFTEKQKEDEADLYDKVQCSGLIDQVIAHMDQDEYNTLVDYLEVNKENTINNNQSFSGVLRMLVDDLPVRMKETMEVIDANKDKFPEVERLAKLATATGMNNDKLPVNSSQTADAAKVVQMPTESDKA